MDGWAQELLRVERYGDDAAREAAVRQLAGVDATTWRDLDRALRRVWWAGWDGRGVVPRIQRGEGGVLLAVLAASHPDGYAREAAVRRLAELADPVTLPPLAIRTGDWVPKVRDRARAAVAGRLTSVDDLLGIGPAAILLAGRARGDWLRTNLDSAIGELPDRDAVRLLAATDVPVRRAAYSVALSNDRLGGTALLDAALNDSDLIVRTRCAHVVVRAARDTGRRDDLVLLATSGMAAIRADAVWALGALGDHTAARRALMDRSPVVREIAQAVVRRDGDDPAEAYRAAVPPVGAEPAALAGLGECGGAGDVAVVTGYLRDPLPRVRRAAVQALRRLGAVDVQTLAAMLDDPSGAVVRHRQVVVTLVHDTGIAAGRMAELLAPSSAPHVRAGAYRLHRANDVWTRLSTDLELWDDEQLGGVARADVAAWLQRDASTTYSLPTGKTADRLEVLLQRAAPSLGPERARVLRFHLGLSGGSGDAPTIGP